MKSEAILCPVLFAFHEKADGIYNEPNGKQKKNYDDSGSDVFHSNSYFALDHLARAAFRAIADRWPGVNFPARDLPPFLPRATAWGFFRLLGTHEPRDACKDNRKPAEYRNDPNPFIVAHDSILGIALSICQENS